jgi:hypothetical protein
MRWWLSQLSIWFSCHTIYIHQTCQQTPHLELHQMVLQHCNSCWFLKFSVTWYIMWTSSINTSSTRKHKIEVVKVPAEFTQVSSAPVWCVHLLQPVTPDRQVNHAEPWSKQHNHERSLWEVSSSIYETNACIKALYRFWKIKFTTCPKKR